MNQLTTRRTFLKLLRRFFLGLSGFLGLGGLARFFSYQPDPGRQNQYDLGPREDYPDGSQVVRMDIPAIIRCSEEEITALSLTCTHLGCTVEPEGQGFTCPCHGSRFDREGQVLQGPAQDPLRALRVEVNEENTLWIFIH